MIANKINITLNLGASHIFYFYLGNWYHHLKRFPGILVDKNGYVKFDTQEDYLNNQFLQHGKRLHIRDGICTIPGYIEFTEEEKYVVNQFSNEINDINTQAERKPRNIDSIVRNLSLVRLVKRLRNNTCQICNLRLEVGNNSFYSEVHHIRPLGIPHNGPDIISNMMCVCPNCHIRLDYGFSQIEFNNIIHLPRHRIDNLFVEYHNQRVQF